VTTISGEAADRGKLDIGSRFRQYTVAGWRVWWRRSDGQSVVTARGSDYAALLLLRGELRECAEAPRTLNECVGCNTPA